MTRLRGQLAEAARLEHSAIETAIKREEIINMWKMAAFAGWFGLFLFAMQGHW